MSEIVISLTDLLSEMKKEYRDGNKKLEDKIEKIQDDLARKTETIIENKVRLALYTAGGGVIGGGSVVTIVEIVKAVGKSQGM